ncbi:hypothetical protein [Halobacteriovorax sp.]|uniref:hypothetical protein n=1 Tax=Halobacteriovorax sp. TaxID=2020862 RepID=UPI003AF232E6
MKNILILIATLISYSAFASNVDFPDYTCNVSKYPDDTVFGEEFEMKRDNSSRYNLMSTVVDNIEFKVALVDKASGPQASFTTNYKDQGIQVSSQQDFNGVQIIFGPTHQVGTTGYIVTCDRSSLDW